MTPDQIRQALHHRPETDPQIELERHDTALRLMLNALDNTIDAQSPTVLLNRNTLCRDLATALKVEVPE